MKHGKSRRKAKASLLLFSVRARRVGLSPLEEHRLRRRLRSSACSETWVDDQIKTVHDRGSDGQAILYRYHDAAVFPPGGKNGTAMRWCRFCGRYTPGHCIHRIEHRSTRAGEIQSSTLQCDDCRLGIDAEMYRELHDAGLFLRPAGSMAFVRMRERLIERMRG
jgi:hypothetical protein